MVYCRLRPRASGAVENNPTLRPLGVTCTPKLTGTKRDLLHTITHGIAGDYECPTISFDLGKSPARELNGRRRSHPRLPHSAFGSTRMTAHVMGSGQVG